MAQTYSVNAKSSGHSANAQDAAHRAPSPVQLWLGGRPCSLWWAEPLAWQQQSLEYTLPKPVSLVCQPFPDEAVEKVAKSSKPSSRNSGRKEKSRVLGFVDATGAFF